MNRKLKKVSIGLGILVVLCAGVYFLLPGVLVEGSIKINCLKANISEKEIKAGQFTWSYYEAGEKNHETLVLVHGFGANKSRWIENIKALKELYHVYAPDMPGFGKTNFLASENYYIESYANYLNNFVESHQIKKFHLVGVSMGGLISGYYAVLFPEKILTLTLSDCAGVIAPVLSEYQKHYLNTGENLLVYQTVDGFDKINRLAYVNPRQFSYPIKKYLVDEKVKRQEGETKIFNQMIASGVNLLGDKLSSIQSKTLVIWGEQDRIIDVSVTEIIREKVKNARIYIVKDASHLPNEEKPEEFNRVLKDFIRN